MLIYMDLSSSNYLGYFFHNLSLVLTAGICRTEHQKGGRYAAKEICIKTPPRPPTHLEECQIICFQTTKFFFFFFFLGPHLQHGEVPSQWSNQSYCWPTPQLMATPDPQPAEQGCVLMDTRRIRFRYATTGTPQATKVVTFQVLQPHLTNLCLLDLDFLSYSVHWIMPPSRQLL